MENEVTFKQQYKIGLDLLKEDIEKCKNDKIYSPIIPYFEYPISLIEQEVSDVICKNNDSEEYYEQKCKQIKNLYDRLAKTVAIISEKFTPLSTKIRRRYQNTIYNLTKRMK